MYTIKKTQELRDMELGRVSCYPWGGDYRPEMLFKIGHGEDALLVNLLCYEEAPVITATERNGAVWNDSCLEFFVSPSEDLSAGYFNFQINAHPTLLLHYGPDGVPTTMILKTNQEFDTKFYNMVDAVLVAAEASGKVEEDVVSPVVEKDVDAAAVVSPPAATAGGRG